MELLSAHAFLFAVASCVVYCIVVAVYRLHFSPIAKFPGPKLAALTLWFEFYYDVVKGGQYTWEIERLHEKYGPIVRINPYELHINDPDYYDEVYVGNSRRTNKWPWSAKMFGYSTAGFATESHELHRIRRGALSSFFSKGSMLRLEPVVQTVVDKLVARLEKVRGSSTVVNVMDMFTAFTADVIGFAPSWRQFMAGIGKNSHFAKQFGWFVALMRRIPLRLTKIFTPEILPILELRNMTHGAIQKLKKELEAGHKPTGQTTVFLDILTNPNLRPQEKETEYLIEESFVVVSAGTVTTAHILSVITFHLVNNKDMLAKLQSELRTIMPDSQSQPKWSQLEQLPYMKAVVNEGLRIGYGVSHRLQRVSPDVALQFNEWTIPVNTPVSMSAALIHNNPTIFPNPRSFDPERWMHPSTTRLQKNLVSFSRGTRQCLGMNLAYCEIYLTLAAFFAPARFSFDLFESDITDIETPHDFFAPGYRHDSKGVRIVVR